MHFIIKTQYFTPTLGVCLYIELILITQNVHFENSLHSEGGVTPNYLNILFQVSKIKILFLISHFQIQLFFKKNALRLYVFKKQFSNIEVRFDSSCFNC